MAFDIYAGPVSRFYADEWENVVQAKSRKDGISYSKIRASKEPFPSMSQVRESVLKWQEAASHYLKDHIREPLSWDESDAAPYFTDRPGWQGYSALLLTTAYVEAEKTPPSAHPDEWFTDAVYLEMLKQEGKSRYAPLLEGGFWIPCDFDFGFMGPNILGDQIFIASSSLLLHTLDKLNELHFKATEADLKKYLIEEIDASDQLERDAKFTLAVFHDIAKKSIAHRVPILLSF